MAEIISMNEFDEKVLKADKPVLVDFYAVWCGPCKMLSPTINELSESQTDFLVYKVDIDEDEDLCIKYRVRSVPTLIAFKNGEAVKQAVGVQSKEAIIEMMNNL